MTKTFLLAEHSLALFIFLVPLTNGRNIGSTTNPSTTLTLTTAPTPSGKGHKLGYGNYGYGYDRDSKVDCYGGRCPYVVNCYGDRWCKYAAGDVPCYGAGCGNQGNDFRSYSDGNGYNYNAYQNNGPCYGPDCYGGTCYGPNCHYGGYNGGYDERGRNGWYGNGWGSNSYDYEDRYYDGERYYWVDNGQYYSSNQRRGLGHPVDRNGKPLSPVSTSTTENGIGWFNSWNGGGNDDDDNDGNARDWDYDGQPKRKLGDARGHGNDGLGKAKPSNVGDDSTNTGSKSDDNLDNGNQTSARSLVKSLSGLMLIKKLLQLG